jgi:RNA polymerase sigma-70 factor, ECF subfamily
MNSQIYSRQDEESLVRTASRGDLDSFNQLVLIHQDLVYQHAYSLMGDPTRAEDITQDTFIKAFQALSSFRGGSFRAWLLRIVKNSAYDALRGFQRHPTQPLFPEDDNGEEIESAPWLADPSVSVQDTVEQNELSEEIHAMMKELPETYRTVLTLIDLHQFDYSEAAETLHIPIGTVKSRLARARLQMQEKLKNNGIFKPKANDSKLCMAV